MLMLRYHSIQKKIKLRVVLPSEVNQRAQRAWTTADKQGKGLRRVGESLSVHHIPTCIFINYAITRPETWVVVCSLVCATIKSFITQKSAFPLARTWSRNVAQRSGTYDISHDFANGIYISSEIPLSCSTTFRSSKPTLTTSTKLV